MTGTVRSTSRRYTRAEAQQLLAERGRAGPAFGRGPLALVVAGVQELTPRVRSPTCFAPPMVGRCRRSHRRHRSAGAHRRWERLDAALLDRFPTRPAATCWEIAVLREDAGGGGSAALHAHYTVGLRERRAAGNDFALHTDARPALLIAGGIGITPIRAMAHALLGDQAVISTCTTQRAPGTRWPGRKNSPELGARLSRYFADKGERLDAEALLSKVPDDALVYVCGPVSAVIDDDGLGRSAARPSATAYAANVSALRGSRGHKLPSGCTSGAARVDVGTDRRFLQAVRGRRRRAVLYRAGHCGRCAMVLAGSPLHLDAPCRMPSA